MRHFQIRSDDGHRPELVRVVLGGELDLAAYDELNRALTAAAGGEPPPHRVEVDLAAVRLLDCSTIGSIIAARRSAERQGVHVYLTNVRGPAARMLELTGVWGSLTRHAPVAPG